jgi:DNA-binding PadR family transcriptional regulator
LSASAAAILGLLMSGARSGYELAREMDHTLRFVWPRATSKLYEAPKRLVAQGLATARQEHTGQRPRTVYTITPHGRRAVQAWLRSTPAPIELEAEPIVRVWFGHLGSHADLVAAIEAVRAQANAALGHGVRLGHARLAAMPPERGHVAALLFRFLWEYNLMLVHWATWARAEIDGWSDTAPDRAKLDRAAEILRACLAELDADRPA